MQELRALVDGYPEEQLGLVIDTGHAWTMKRDPSLEIKFAGSRLQGTHLQDVDYDQPNDNHWAPTQGGLDWSAIRRWPRSDIPVPGPLKSPGEHREKPPSSWRV